ncbi:MAG TPA: SpoIIE family protein phosphatase [Steroidobacteraceae bacterium]|nr:SpoIIE family protein phosphatase [Steroidobacteraceae bacterium]
MKLREYRAQQRFVIDEGSKVGEARRAAHTLANFEFDAELAGKVAIAATELASNLLRHAGGGELLLQKLGSDDSSSLELLAIDRGPGMADVSRCMSDGYSTGGTQGTGLGAVRRLASEFDIYSAPGEGTVVMARFGGACHVRHGAVNVAVAGEPDCGDAWCLVRDVGGIALMVIDGLGHGTFAAEAARAGIDAFLLAPGDSPREILQRANQQMSKTRGGAAACARLANGSMSYAGMGNINGYLVSPERSQGLVSHNGTLGMHQRPAQQFEYSVDPDSLLVMHSDGLSARWDLRSQPDLLRAHPAIVAGVLYRDHGRERDDATVVVVAA